MRFFLGVRFWVLFGSSSSTQRTITGKGHSPQALIRTRPYLPTVIIVLFVMDAIVIRRIAASTTKTTSYLIPGARRAGIVVPGVAGCFVPQKRHRHHKSSPQGTLPSYASSPHHFLPKILASTATTAMRYSIGGGADDNGAGAAHKTPQSSLLDQLRQLDTACLCDADKSVLSTLSANDNNNNDETSPDYDPLRLLNPMIRPINVNFNGSTTTMAGWARTVQCTKRNDFMAVLRGLAESRPDEVLVVHTLHSNRAVAGELFATEATRRGLAGIVITDGPMRDTKAIRESFESNLLIRCFALRITPYAGTIQSPGEMQTSLKHEYSFEGGTDDDDGRTTFRIDPGDVIVGDDDGVIVGTKATFERLLPIAQSIQKAEQTIQTAMEVDGANLLHLTNFDEHLKKRLAGEESVLQFRL